MHHQPFYLERVNACTYRIFPSTGGSVQQNNNWRVVVQHGVDPQQWVIKQYNNQANTYTIVEENTDLGVTDPGGAPGPNHQLYLTVLDYNNVVPQQRYKIVPA
ncbi:hypothetical protein V8B97DRAFT_2010521 [Scleroderma yunnanense]